MLTADLDLYFFFPVEKGAMVWFETCYEKKHTMLIAFFHATTELSK